MQFLGHPNKLILMAEDDSDDEEMLHHALLEVDPTWELRCITNGKKFVHHLETLTDDQLPSLFLLDYNLPELTGIEIVQFLNGAARYAGIPKIVWSTATSPVFKTMSKELGVNEYIMKPSDIVSYQTIARQMLEIATQHE